MAAISRRFDEARHVCSDGGAGQPIGPAKSGGRAMADPSTAFVGAVPANYDRYLGPILFHHYADDLVARLPVTPGMRVLKKRFAS
jgi:hypothetical protein